MLDLLGRYRALHSVTGGKALGVAIDRDRLYGVHAEGDHLLVEPETIKLGVLRGICTHLILPSLAQDD